VIRVAEEHRNAYGARVECSWREWDLLNNRQVKVLRVCKSPFETIDGKPRKKPGGTPEQDAKGVGCAGARAPFEDSGRATQDKFSFC
jgi:hypothetical protein